MVEAVEDPGEEGMHFEEDALLAELVELRVAVEEARGYELVEDAEDEWREDGEEDVVEGEGPGFEDDFAGKGVLKGVLSSCVSGGHLLIREIETYPKLSHVQGNVFVERIKNDL